jgi:nucleotide-binding universal stress UspA family protein
MFKSILVAIDGSEVSDAALQGAVELAHALSASLRVVHVVDEVNLSRDSEFDNLNEIVKPVKERGNEVLKSAVDTARTAGVEPESKLLELDRLHRSVADLIAHEADQWRADLVVVGSHGRRGIRRLLLGSVAEQLMRTTARPVLLIRGQPEEGPTSGEA